ncbi:MAG: hypothetical protein HY360_19475 [Verrucomicrobia bacterium]|nr:hypothetical protein [Verrucomicrobiota bacterium]
MVHAGRHELAFRVRCGRGYQSGYVRLRPGMFDANTLDCRMREHPSGKMVVSKAWDVFNHEQNKMAVPCFTPWLNGRDLGDVWFDIPNYQDGERGALNTEFGFHVSHPGLADVRLVVVEAHRRNFHWGMVETLRIEPDSRKPAPIEPVKRVRENPREPWLFLHGCSAKQARAQFRANQALRAPIARMLRLFEAGHVVPYVNNEQVIAAAAFLTESPAWIALAKKKLRELCSMPTWARRPNPRVMHGDNDMGPGYNLTAVSMLAHLLWDKLDHEERGLALWKAREYGRRLYEFSVLNKCWAAGMGDIVTHESGTLLGQSIGAMVFYHEFPEARDWLAWAHGRMLHALDTAPVDGRAFWISYSSNFVLSHAAAIFDFGGVNLFRMPYLANVADAILRCRHTPSSLCDVAQMGELYSRHILATVAKYARSSEAAWGWHWYWKTLAKRYGDKHFVGWQDMLWHFPKGRPPKDDHTRSHIFKDTGMAFLRTSEEKPRFCCVYQSGMGAGRHGFRLRNRYNLETHSVGADGGVFVLVDGAFVIMSNPGCYRKGFQNESVVTVDGAGHYMDGRWLGCDIKESWLSKMRSFQCMNGKTVAIGDNTGAYREELGVMRSRRKVTLLKNAPCLVIEDSIQLRIPHKLAAFYQCTGKIKEIGPGRFEFISGNMAELSRNDAYKNDPPRRLVLEVANPDRYRIRIMESQMVLPYIYGMNTGQSRKQYKGIGTAPPPRPQHLAIVVPCKTREAIFRVEMKPL